MSDDDIEIVGESTADASFSGNNDICQLCPRNLSGLSATERDDHYDEHKSGLPFRSRSKRGRSKPTSASTSQRKTTPMKFGKSANNAAREDVFWYPTQAVAPPDNYSPGVLSILKEALKISHRGGSTQRAVLCYERTPHIYREIFDSSWGCGYRNFLMVCAALMDQPFQDLYFPNLDAPLPPSVRNLQIWIEGAWEQGYDDSGARELDHKLVSTKKKIGTGELYVAFTSRKIPCTLVDFNLKGSHKGFDTLTEWVVKYFTPKPSGDVNTMLRATSPVVATEKMPIILQYEGHSVTIVGYELGKNGKYNLLVFDPSSKVNGDIRQAALNAPASANRTSSLSVSLGKSKCRERSESPAPKKRSRTNQNSDDAVVSIPDSDDEKIDDARRAVALKFPLDPDTVVKSFRFKRPKQKNDYQLLYFTLGAPLSDQEQINRKVVLSDREC